MNWLSLILTSAGLGVGLAMDAFSVSLADGLAEPGMKRGRICLIAGVYAGFQFLMPEIGWLCVSTLAAHIEVFNRFIPWIAFVLLAFIGTKMIIEAVRSIRSKETAEEEKLKATGAAGLLIQGIATSIDALSVGFTTADYSVWEALLSSAIIGAVTFAICAAGLVIGKKAGTALAGKAGIVGGVILIAIGIKIIVTALIG